MIIEIPENTRCGFEGCVLPATEIACGRGRAPSGHPEVSVYCYPHAYQVADEQSPEYEADCPNCGCKFGVN